MNISYKIDFPSKVYDNNEEIQIEMNNQIGRGLVIIQLSHYYHIGIYKHILIHMYIGFPLMIMSKQRY